MTAHETMAEHALRGALARLGWEPTPASLYDEEGVEGWRWEHTNGDAYCAIGDWDAPPAIPDALRDIALEKQAT